MAAARRAGIARLALFRASAGAGLVKYQRSIDTTLRWPHVALLDVEQNLASDYSLDPAKGETNQF
jgi:hypothetical protein